MNNAVYAEIDLPRRERLSLAPGTYGSSKQSGLKILQHIPKASKPDKTGAMRNAFLVAAEVPSREQQQLATGNGKAPDLSFDGTAFLHLTINQYWTARESIVLAFTEASRDKEGQIKINLVERAIALDAGKSDDDQDKVTAESIERARAYYYELAQEKLTAANTPEENWTAAMEEQYRRELMQISIKVGEFFHLQDWLNWNGDIQLTKSKRDPQLDPLQLVGIKFSGRVEARKQPSGGSSSEVVRVYPPS